MKHLYNDHISGVKIEVQKLYSVKVKIIARLIFVTTIIHFRKKNWTSWWGTFPVSPRQTLTGSSRSSRRQRWWKSSRSSSSLTWWSSCHVMTWHDHQKTPRRLKIKSLWSFLIVMISLINVLILIFIFIAMIITKIKIITIILILNQEIIELERKKLDLTQRERELAEQLEEDRSGIIISKFYL